MTFIWGFLPWIAYAAVSSLGWQWGAATALLASIVAVARDRRSATVLDIGTLIYFAALTVFAFIAPDSPLQRYDGSLSSLWLALIAWTTIVIGQPFTLSLARRRTAPEVWESPRFKHTNVVITSAWATSFTLAAAAGFVAESTDASLAVNVAIRVLGFVLPMWFTQRYIARVRRVAVAG